MRLYKLLEILQQLKVWGVNFHGMIYPTGGGEIALEFQGQLEHHVHDYLLDKGFVDVDCDYIYRPRRGRS